MIAAIQAIFTSIVNFFNTIWNFLSNGIYDLLVWVFRSFIEFYTLATLKIQLFALTLGWDVAKGIIVDMQLSSRLQGFFDALPSSVSVNLLALRIPECISIILTAYITRYVIRFIPGSR